MEKLESVQSVFRKAYEYLKVAHKENPVLVAEQTEEERLQNRLMSACVTLAPETTEAFLQGKTLLVESFNYIKKYISLDPSIQRLKEAAAEMGETKLHDNVKLDFFQNTLRCAAYEYIGSTYKKGISDDDVQHYITRCYG